ncbi:hypothetical protein [Hymenobacter sp. BT491]|uniref:hypothetical protein n=1 Tax=Hymenobacter sp. BT491 TaxID=2766779 RepID=UPI001653D388|nr:hypothetical protein [Hymenobacter sp. BT491]MBC6992221.1 hypothetical protein [Hymenobacter sp. BT491]
MAPLLSPLTEEQKIEQLATELQAYGKRAADTLFAPTDFFQATRLHIVRDPDDVARYHKKAGCYFVFSTLPKTRVPTFSDYGLFDNYPITKGPQVFRCLYNGIHGSSVGARLKQHLFSTQTPDQLRIAPLRRGGKARTLAATGALSLERITPAEIKELRQEFPGCHSPTAEGNLIHCRQLKTGSPAHYLGIDARLLNGINITESQWHNDAFAVIVIPVVDHSLRPLLEDGFRRRFGWPPLCKR